MTGNGDGDKRERTGRAAADGGAKPERDPAVSSDRMDGLHLAGALRTLLRHHRQMGIEHYPSSPGLQGFLYPQERPAPPVEGKNQAVEPAVPTRAEAVAPTTPEKAGAGLQALDREIDACRQCCLASARQGVVHARGIGEAVLMVVGDYSVQSAEFSAATLFGAAEDTMLWNMMRAIGLAPEQVYVTNAVKCCPLAAKVPNEESIRCCHGFLVREIELVQPKMVCAMGEIAVRALTGAQGALVRLRGRFHPCRLAYAAGEPLQVMATFHPRFLLKNIELKKAAWQDLQLIQRRLQT
ncbi:MAG: uracil-DNA glycosylase [Desulfobulbus sp.]|uniref:uracil-DNA glycosylase n=1 Tax=Desulfobulbus sp. TaxID=895 RepID=UPI002844F6FB|nr:uracil-DNA glycosylase [Desulfobulbus sp.]MDR2551404.1 uracil-DNA glycosylase [Desulfobulbus sp.]